MFVLGFFVSYFWNLMQIRMWLWIYRLLICILIELISCMLFWCILTMDWHRYFFLMVISQWTIYLSRITSHLKHCFFFDLDVTVIGGTLNTQWYEFAPLWYFRLAIPPTSSAYRCCEMRIRGVLLSFLCVFDSVLLWHIFPMKGHSPCSHWLWEIPVLLPICICIFRSCIAPNGHIASVWRFMWIYCLIEERCVTVFSGNPEWLCSFVFPLSSNCHLLGFLRCICLGFNLDFANAKLYWFFLHCPF